MTLSYSHHPMTLHHPLYNKSPLPWREGMEGRGKFLFSPSPLPSPIEGEGANWFNRKTATG
jgi:hypothetical protein